MHKVWIAPISVIFVVLLSLLIVPIYADSVDFSLTITNITVIDDPIVDFEKIPVDDIVVIQNVTKTTLIKIPSNVTSAVIKFQGDAIKNKIVTLQNYVTIDAKNMNAVIVMKNQTIITNNTWNGELIFAKIIDEQITNQENVVSFQFGNDKVSLEFTPPVKLTFKDSAKKNVFITSPGQGRAQITTVCNSVDVSLVILPSVYPKACYINVGDDLVVITKHASVFSTSNTKQTTVPTSPSNTVTPSPQTPQKSSSSGGSGRTNVDVNQYYTPIINSDFIKSSKSLVNQWLSGTVYDRLFYALLNGFANNDMITLKQISAEQSYPGWLKITSQWWIDEKINDKEYVDILQWLIDNEIIII